MKNMIKLDNIRALIWENDKAVIKNADIYIKDDRIFRIIDKSGGEVSESGCSCSNSGSYT